MPQNSQDPYAAFGGQMEQSSADPYTAFGGKIDASAAAMQRVGQPTQFEQQRNPANQPGFFSSILSELGGMAKGLPSTIQGMFDPATIAQRGAALFQADQNRQQSQRSLPYRGVAALGQSMGVNAPVMEQQADVGNKAGIMGTAAADAAPYVAGVGARAIADALPSKARAGALLDQAKQVAGDTPIEIETPGQIALRMQQLQQAGSSMPRVVSKFLSRITDPDAKPITYADARDFYSNATALSANESARLSPIMRFNLNQFRVALGQSIQQAANQSGVGDVHAAGMAQYARASKLQAVKEAAADAGVNAAKYAIPGAAAAYGVKKVISAR